MMRTCNPLPLDADTGIAAILRVVDCHTNAAVSTGYARLFGVSGTLGAVLTAALTIYVALLAYRLLLGRSALSLTMITPRVLALGLVLTFATSWPAYQTVVFDLLTRGPEQVAGIVLGRGQGVTLGFAGRLDAIYDDLVDTADRGRGAGGSGSHQPGGTPLLAGDLTKYGALVLLLGTIGTFVTVKIALATLLALGPLFILMALFGGTRGLFEGWLRTTVLFAMAPMLIVLIGSAALAMLAPVISAAASYQAAVPDRVAVMLLAGSVIYVALLLLAFRIAVGMTAGWRLPAGLFGMGGATAGAGTSRELAVPGPAPAALNAGTAQAPAETTDRIGSLIASVSRDGAASGARSAQIITMRAAANTETTPLAEAPSRSNHASRVHGLGQSFRRHATSARQNLSGAIGT